MGRTSKFTFPYPGRKRADPKTKEPTTAPPGTPGLNLSKAQKILGTGGDLNIDSPARDDVSYRSFRPSSRGMSVAVSESTRDGEDGYMSQGDNWDAESGVLPHNIRGKASSTLLGRRYLDDATTTENSSMGSRLRGEASNATMRSHYDKQKSPLAISQQTSASSIRDQALRKPFQPVALSRSPLLEVDNLDNSVFHDQLQRTIPATIGQAPGKKPSRLDLSRMFSKAKKDGAALSPAYPTNSAPVTSPSAATRVRVSETDGRRKLTKKASKDMLSQVNKQVLNPAVPEVSRPPNGAPPAHVNSHTKAHLQQYSRPSLPPPSQPLPRAGLYPKSTPLRTAQPFRSPSATDEEFSWKAVRASLVSPPSPGDKESFTSRSSRNTKESRRSSASVFSNSDLQNNSVLTLSSDEDSDEENITSERGNIHPYQEYSKRQIGGNGEAQRSKRAAPPANINVVATRESRWQDENFLTIPMPSPAGSRISGPWNAKKRESTISEYQTSPDESPSHDYLLERRESVASVTSTATHKSSRFMSVTRQEEALLGALRQKRARMKDEVRRAVIAEQTVSTTPKNYHRISKSPPRHKSHGTQDSRSSISTLKPAISHANHGKFRNRDSSNSSQRTATRVPVTNHFISTSDSNHNHNYSQDSQNTVRDFNAPNPSAATAKHASSTGHILLSLSLPRGGIETAEPSPDLSDFLSFASSSSDDGDKGDKDRTPRTSWIVQSQVGMGMERADSLTGGTTLAVPYHTGTAQPLTPKSAARLSAVGSFGGAEYGGMGSLRREDSNNSRGLKAVAFVDESVRHISVESLGVASDETPSRRDFLSDVDVDDDVVWGM